MPASEGCPYCHSPKPSLFPFKQEGKLVPWGYATAEHRHVYNDRPVTIVVCNDKFHDGMLLEQFLPDILVGEPPKPKPDGIQALIDHIQLFHNLMKASNFSSDQRLDIWRDLGNSIAFDDLVQRAWPT